MITFGDKLTEIRNNSESSVELGRKFEALFISLAKTEPEFGVSDIWRWVDWPDRKKLTGLSGGDSGVDLVARTITDEYIAIQCKCYGEDQRLGKNELNQFFAFSGFNNVSTDELRKVFTSQWVVSTCEWTKTANEFVKAQGKTLTRIDFNEYEKTEYTSVPPFNRGTRRPFPFQQEAIDNCVQALYHNGFPRGRLIMACGTGKTFVSLKVAERLADLTKNRLVLFLAPSIALVAQARREWLTYTRSLQPLVVCSDQTAGGKDEDISIAELKCKVTTDPVEISRFASQKGDSLRVIFCTYQSLQKVVDAQSEYGMPNLGLTIADEAHRTTGVVYDKSKRKVNFQLMHDDASLRSDKRIYMTATERVYDLQSTAKARERGLRVVDMGGENADVYGPPMYRIGFREAVEEERLSEYRVIVLGVSEGSVTPSLRRRIEELEWEGKSNAIRPTVRELVRVLGTSLAVNGVYKLSQELDEPEPLRKVLAFANTIPRSKWYSAAMELGDVKRMTTRRMKDGIALKMRAKHIDGSASARVRFDRLRELENAEKNGETYIVNNVKLFTEGVDVPSLDAVVFLDPRDSQVDVVQAVGRVMRKSPGKKFGYIIVPVILGEHGDWLDALESNSEGFNTIGRVLRALQAHDSRLAEHPEKLVFVVDATNGGGGNGGSGVEEDELGLSLSESLKQVEQQIFAKVVATSKLGKPGKQVADQISQAVKFAASRFRQSECVPVLASKLDITLDEQNREADLTAVSTIAALLLCNACLMHKRLKSTVREMKMIVSLDKLNFSTDPINELFNQWTTILEVDYLPIFAPALSILQSLREGGFTNEETHNAIRPLIECANRVADSLSEMGFDHAGPLYHSILPTGQSDGAFYTNNLSALMLSRLTLPADYIDWSNLDAISKLRILDPACGTGTLLMAMCKTIKDRVAQREDETSDPQVLHKLIVENVVAGLDINHHAVQLAASNLTLGAPTIDYEQINIARMPHGTKHQYGHMQLGSLELLDMKRSDIELEGIGHDFSSIQELGGETSSGSTFKFPVSNLDVVVMNPPFTNNEKRGEKFGDEVRDAMRVREKELVEIVKQSDIHAASLINPNSISTFFTPLADKLIRSPDGSFSKILPTTGLIGTIGKQERAFITSRFDVDVVVTSHDPNRPNFSENTTITESLLICRRKGHRKRKNAKFINLIRMPRTIDEAIKCTDAIASGKLGEWGYQINWSNKKLRRDNFKACLFVNKDLAQICSEFTSDRETIRDIFHVASDLVEIEPAGRRVQDGFKKIEHDKASTRYAALWHHKTERQQYMESTADTSILPKKGKDDYAQSLWKKRSKLLVANRIDTTNVRMAAVFINKKILGAAWVPIMPKHEVPHYLPTLCMWLNSSWSALMFLGMRSKKLTYPTFSLQQLRSIRLPHPNIDLDLKAISTQFEILRKQAMKPWREMDSCPVRKEVDNTCADVFGLDRQEGETIRDLIAREPTVNPKIVSDFFRNHQSKLG